MDFPAPIKRTLSLLGYLDHQPHGQLTNQALRIFCLLSSILLILQSFYKSAIVAESYVDTIRPSIGVMCGVSCVAYYSIMLIYRRRLLDVLAKLQLKVNERKSETHYFPQSKRT